METDASKLTQAPAPEINVLEIAGVSMSFGGLRALSTFNMQVAGGQIHGLIGPNGAGKTTAINVMTGFFSRFGGRISYVGRELPSSPNKCAEAGISRTFQSPTIFQGLSVVENVMCGGHRLTRSGLLRGLVRSRFAKREDARLREAAVTWLARVGYSARPDMPVESLPFGELRKVEIARALMAEPHLLFLDEPTAGLTAEEVGRIGQLLKSLRDAKAGALSIVLVEHNVPFVFSTCERVTVLDRGATIATGTPAEIRDNPTVIETYLGKDTADALPPARTAKFTGRAVVDRQPMLEVRGLTAGYGSMTVVRDINLEVAKGELVILCGRNGSGKSTILNTLAGMPRAFAGVVTLNGRSIGHLSVSERVRKGIGLVPQERGVISFQTVDANLQLASVGLGLGPQEFKRRCDEIMERFPKLKERRSQLAGTLSGGERQMLALAKVLFRKPLVLLLDEPSIGLAPTVIEELAEIVRSINDDGMSILVSEQNVSWVSPIANRAALLERGIITSEGQPEDIVDDERMLESYLGASAEQLVDTSAKA